MKYQFQLKEIATLDFAQQPRFYQMDAGQVRYDCHVSFQVDVPSREVGVLAYVQYQQNDHVFLSMEVGNFFEVEPKTWGKFKLPNRRQFQIPKQFLIHLSMITFGTLRGALHANVSRSSLNNFLLPLVDVTSLVKKNLIVNQ